MKELLLLLVVLTIALIVGVPMYLGPNDLSSCKAPQVGGTCGKADAIITVSGGDTSARTSEAIQLYQDGWADTLIFSGAAADPKGPSNAEAMQRQAVASGVPHERIITEEFSATTKENAENTAQFIEGLELKKVILVTAAYHQRRAALEFRDKLGQGVMIINHPVPTDRQWQGAWWWLRPSGWWLAGSELVKIVAFYTAQGAQKF